MQLTNICTPVAEQLCRTRTKDAVKVRIKFNDDLRERYAPESKNGVVELTLPSGANVSDAFDALQIGDGEIGFVLLNENKVQKEAALSDQDLISIFSLVAGG